MKLRIISFGFRYGVPPEAALILDARSINNPHRDPELRMKTGLSKDVRLRVLGHPSAVQLIDYARLQVATAAQKGKHVFILGIGCTSGRHRSVALAEHLADLFKAEGLLAAVAVKHRDMLWGHNPSSESVRRRGVE